MALVSYSDSEGSDNEAPAAPAPAPKPSTATKSVQRTDARKIKVDLPSIRPERSADGDGAEPPTKRARTAGAFGGFNSLLPAPKRAAQASGLKKGVSLKTSSEAAFSRAAPTQHEEGAEDEYDEYGNRVGGTMPRTNGGDAVAQDDGQKKHEPEVKIVGKATKFKPLSVANSKKKKAVKKAVPAATEEPIVAKDDKIEMPTTSTPVAEPALPPPKVKKSLFSVQESEEDLPPDPEAESFEAPISKLSSEALPSTDTTQQTSSTNISAPLANSLEAVASDLNLTPAQRRQLFGHNRGNATNVRHFDLESEYATNQQLAQNGETFEHRAVKTVAPGKHSLQQLVNNARTNQDSIEDKWAEGRRNRGDAGSKYGW